VKFLIADTFVTSLARLTASEQKAVKTTAFDLQVSPALPGLQFRRLDRARDKNSWSVRAGADIRVIVHRTAGSLVLCYADHHDKAYAWAERRRLETHPGTGAVQIVEVRETVQEIVIPHYTQEVIRPLAGVDATLLHELGVPQEWIGDIREADEDLLLEIADHLPSEAAESILRLAAGEHVEPAPTVAPGDPYRHPDALRRFRSVVDTPQELADALGAPWATWSVFLHPEQKALVERTYAGPARISGSAGTGKTVVAVHRTVHLAMSTADSRILLTTFSEPLARDLRNRLKLLLRRDPRAAERIDVETLSRVATRLSNGWPGRTPSLLEDAELHGIVPEVLAESDVTSQRITPAFLSDEWRTVVDAWNVQTWEAYRDIPRIGRRTRLSQAQRQEAWRLLARIRERVEQLGSATESGLLHALADKMTDAGAAPYDYVIVDEAQDLSVAQLRFLAAVSSDRTNALFLCGDLGQQIFRLPFSWRALGIDVRGNSHILRVNYRTSHQIRSTADLLLDRSLRDADGNEVARTGTVSMFNGPAPEVKVFADQPQESGHVADWITNLLREGFSASEVALFARSRYS
jgi:hypothetical protein